MILFLRSADLVDATCVRPSRPESPCHRDLIVLTRLRCGAYSPVPQGSGSLSFPYLQLSNIASVLSTNRMDIRNLYTR